MIFTIGIRGCVPIGKFILEYDIQNQLTSIFIDAGKTQRKQVVYCEVGRQLKITTKAAK